MSSTFYAQCKTAMWWTSVAVAIVHLVVSLWSWGNAFFSNASGLEISPVIPPTAVGSESSLDMLREKTPDADSNPSVESRQPEASNPSVESRRPEAVTPVPTYTLHNPLAASMLHETFFLFDEMRLKGRVKLRTQRYPADLFAGNWWGKEPPFYTLKRRTDPFQSQTVTPCGQPCYVFAGGWPLVNFTRLQKPCVAYSFGIGGDYRFEDYVAKTWHCAIHAFDPTAELRKKHEKLKPDAVTFHFRGLRPARVPLSQGSKNNYGFIDEKLLSDLPSLLAENGHSYLDVLKIDCEGCEWAVFQDLDAEWLGKHVQRILIEVHFHKPPATIVSSFWNTTLHSFRLTYRHVVVKPGFRKKLVDMASRGVTELHDSTDVEGLFFEYAFENMNAVVSASP